MTEIIQTIIPIFATLNHFSFFQFLLGLITGFAIVISGGGGAILILPFLTEVWGLGILTAIGTSSLFTFCSRLFASRAHWKKDAIDKDLFWATVRVAAPAAILSAFLVNWYQLVNPDIFLIVKNYLKISVAVIILIGAGLSLIKFKKNNFSTVNENLMFWSGIFIGIAIGVSGVGLLVLLFFMLLNVPQKKIIDTSLLASSALTGITALPYLFFGSIDYFILGAMLLGALIGIKMGAPLINKVPQEIIKYFILLIAVLGAIKMLWPVLTALQNY